MLFIYKTPTVGAPALNGKECHRVVQETPFKGARKKKGGGRDHRPPGAIRSIPRRSNAGADRRLTTGWGTIGRLVTEPEIFIFDNQHAIGINTWRQESGKKNGISPAYGKEKEKVLPSKAGPPVSAG